MKLYKRRLSLFIAVFMIFSSIFCVAQAAGKMADKINSTTAMEINDLRTGEIGDTDNHSTVYQYINSGEGKETNNDIEQGINSDEKVINAIFRKGETAGEASARIGATNDALDSLWNIVRDIITWLIGFGIISSVLVCLFNFFKMATAPSHPAQRRTCMESIVVSLICIVLLGGLAIVLKLFYGTFGDSLSEGLIYAKDWRYPATAFLIQYGNLIAGFSGVISLTMLLCFGYSFTKLALSGGNPQKKGQAIQAIATTAIATVGVGGVTTVVSVLTGLL